MRFVVHPNKEALFNIYSCYGVHLSACQCMAVVSGLLFSDPALKFHLAGGWSDSEVC